MDMELKKFAQMKWEEKYIEEYPYENHAKESARGVWMKEIGRSYL